MNSTITPRAQKVLAWQVLIAGLILTALGLFGVWLQGLFWEIGRPSGLTVGELRLAFTLPTAVTTTGSLLVAIGILVGPLTESWTNKRRVITLFIFAASVLVACAVCGHLAGSRVAPIM